MKYDVGFTALEIARFYYERDIPLSDMIRISNEIWNSKEPYIETFIYNDRISFIKEIEKILDNMIFKRELNKENSDIKMIQNELDLEYEDFNTYRLKSSSGEEFLKQVRLRLDFETKKDFVYMKMRTLVRNYGYKRRNSNFIKQLKSDLDALDLCIALRERKFYDIYDLMNIKLDDTIRIYSINMNCKLKEI